MPHEVRVKKVNAYPIRTQLMTESGPAEAQILKITPIGVLAEIGTPFLQAGDKLEMIFELPVLHKQVHELGVVVKLYNQFSAAPKFDPQSAKGEIAVPHDKSTGGAPKVPVAPPSPPLPQTPEAKQSIDAQANARATPYGRVQHIAEIHFKPLSERGKKNIGEFLQLLGKAAGQAK